MARVSTTTPISDNRNLEPFQPVRRNPALCEECPIRAFGVCCALTDEELFEISNITSRSTVPSGQTVFYEGDKSTSLINIVSGAVRISKTLPDGRRQIIGFLFPGDFLGLPVNGAYSCTADALSETVLCRFRRTKFDDLLDRFPKLERKLLDLASNEIAEAQEHIVLLGRKTAAERVCSALLQLVRRIGNEQEDGHWAVTLPMTRDDLADYLGLRVETISRTITRLCRDETLSMDGSRRIIVADLEQLETMAGS